MAREHLALALFVQATASLTKDGECVSCGKDGYEPNPDCHTHAPWDMRNDDAVETLHGLISNARRLNNQRAALSLEDAIHQIEQFADTLNVSGRMCDACKQMHYENFGEYQLHVELTAMVNKLKGIPRRLADKKGTTK